MNVELQLLSQSDLYSDDKWYVEAYKVYLNLLWLSGEVGTGAGDVQGGADHRPTDASVQVLEMIEKDLAAAQADYSALIDKEVPAFNKTNARLKIAIKTTN
jgi:enamine deaminase RidA (YjgF/YER057c/UK114 family)